MKKALKWISIIAGGLVLILVIAVIALPFVLPLDKIKNFAVAEISKVINREVKIEKVSFDIFSGIKLEKISVSNQAGFAAKPFVSADALELRYAFWPLLSRQLIIKEIRLVKPEVLIEKSVYGEFNFSDLIKAKKPKNEKPKPKADTGGAVPAGRQVTAKPKTKPPFTLFVNKISFTKGSITYIDHITEASSQAKDINIGVFGIVLGIFKPIDLKASATAVYQGKEIPLSLSGKIGLDLEKEAVNISSLLFSLAGEKVSVAVKVSGWKTSPTVDFSLNSDQLSVDPILAVFAAPAPAEIRKVRPKPGELTKTVDRAVSNIPANLNLSGRLKLGRLSFQKFKADGIDLSLTLANRQLSLDLRSIKIYDGKLSGKASANLNRSGLSYRLSGLKLVGFNAHPFSNDVVETFLTSFPDYEDLVNKVYGALDLNLDFTGGGVEVADILGNLSGGGSFSLKNGELKRLKAIEAVADKVKMSALKRDLKLSGVSSGFSMANQIITLKKFLLKSSNLQAAFDGGVDLHRQQYVAGNRLALRGSPSLTKDVPREFSVFRDKDGWLELAFELTGSLKKPIPVPRLEKPIEQTVGKIKLKIEAKKLEIQQKADDELKQKEEEAKAATEAVKEEAKQKLREIFR